MKNLMLVGAVVLSVFTSYSGSASAQAQALTSQEVAAQLHQAYLNNTRAQDEGQTYPNPPIDNWAIVKLRQESAQGTNKGSAQ